MAGPEEKIGGGVIAGTLVGAATMLGGYLLERGDQSSFGGVVFLFVPFLSGMAISFFVKQDKRQIAASAVCAGIFSLGIMVLIGLEGIICSVMAFPIIGIGMLMGVIVGSFIRKLLPGGAKRPDKLQVIFLLIMPVLIFGADRLERPHRLVQSRQTFVSEITINCTPEQAWKYIAEMDKLDGPKPFLLNVGLPIPTKCVLDGEAVGGRRTCYFDQGKIEQELTCLDFPSRMQLRVVENTLPGRHWLTFLNAEYEFISQGAATRVIRRTTIGTRLYPRFYWRFFEGWGVSSEHEYVLSNLQRWAESNGASPSP